MGELKDEREATVRPNRGASSVYPREGETIAAGARGRGSSPAVHDATLGQSGRVRRQNASGPRRKRAIESLVKGGALADATPR